MGPNGTGSLLAAALLAAGCAFTALHGLEAGRSSEGDVRRALGEPALTLAGSGGARQLAYPGGPYGTQTWMAHLGPDGRLVRLEQALTDDNIQRLSPGETTREEVLRLIGPPWRTIDFPNKGQVAWDYRVQDTWGYLADLSVMIDSRGIVAEKVVVRVDKEHSDSR